MNPSTRRLDWLVWTGLVLVLGTILLVLLLGQLKARMLLGQPLPSYGHVAEFSLTNQLGQAVTPADLRGQVWVSDLIFTRCAGPCLKMSRQMKELQDALPSQSRARLISLTTDPAFDTPSVLKTYGQRFGADPQRWWFLTGSQNQLTNLAIGSLKLTALEKKPEERTTPVDLFIHSTIFVVVDKHAELRGIFETSGDSVDPKKTKDQVLAAVNRLEREP